MTTCEHLDSAPTEVNANTPDGCEECLAIGSR